MSLAELLLIVTALIKHRADEALTCRCLLLVHAGGLSQTA